MVTDDKRICEHSGVELPHTEGKREITHARGKGLSERRSREWWINADTNCPEQEYFDKDDPDYYWGKLINVIEKSAYDALLAQLVKWAEAKHEAVKERDAAIELLDQKMWIISQMQGELIQRGCNFDFAKCLEAMK